MRTINNTFLNIIITIEQKKNKRLKIIYTHTKIIISDVVLVASVAIGYITSCVFSI